MPFNNLLSARSGAPQLRSQQCRPLRSDVCAQTETLQSAQIRTKERKEPAMIKGSLIVLACMLLTAPFAHAQKTEAFVGYTNLQSEGLPEKNDPAWSAFDVPFFKQRTTLHGVNGAFTGYVAEGFSFTGDVSWSRRGHNSSSSGIEQSRHIDTSYFVGGPSIKFSRDTRWQPFARIMAGVAHTSFQASSTASLAGGGTTTSSFDVGSNDFTATAGGGLDLRLGERTKLRLFQVDWMPVFLSDRSVQILGDSGVIPTTLNHQRQDNWRFSIGFVF
jgi:hypothetical protein